MRHEVTLRRRRLLFRTGLGALLLTITAALAFGTGCIFDDGSGYQGGGRRASLPTASEDQSPLPQPTSSTTGSTTGSSTSSSTSTSPPPDSGSPPDAGAD